MLLMAMEEVYFLLLGTHTRVPCQCHRRRLVHLSPSVRLSVPPILVAQLEYVPQFH